MPEILPTLTDVVDEPKPTTPPLPAAARVPEQRGVRTPPARPRVAPRSRSVPAVAVGALALAALAVGAVAVGRLAIHRLSVRRAHIARLRIDELQIGRLNVREPHAPLAR